MKNFFAIVCSFFSVCLASTEDQVFIEGVKVRINSIAQEYVMPAEMRAQFFQDYVNSYKHPEQVIDVNWASWAEKAIEHKDHAMRYALINLLDSIQPKNWEKVKDDLINQVPFNENAIEEIADKAASAVARDMNITLETAKAYWTTYIDTVVDFYDAKRNQAKTTCRDEDALNETYLNFGITPQTATFTWLHENFVHKWARPDLYEFRRDLKQPDGSVTTKSIQTTCEEQLRGSLREYLQNMVSINHLSKELTEQGDSKKKLEIEMSIRSEQAKALGCR